MKERIRNIIRYATNGNASAFASSLGWKPQYLNNLINTEAGIGLSPVMEILSVYPEVDARWLLFGTGSMLTDVTASLRDGLFRLASIERGDGENAEFQKSETCAQIAKSAKRLQRYFSDCEKGGKTAIKLHRVQ